MLNHAGRKRPERCRWQRCVPLRGEFDHKIRSSVGLVAQYELDTIESPDLSLSLGLMAIFLNIVGPEGQVESFNC
jgi:hypothetical protein